MNTVAKHHRIQDIQDVHGEDQEWLSIDCQFIESGLRYAKKNDCRRILFRPGDDKEKVKQLGIDVLAEVKGLEGLIWMLPISKRADLSALQALEHLKHLSLWERNLDIDLAWFPQLEYFGFRFSESVTGYRMASKSLRHVRVIGLCADLGFLGVLKNLVKLDLVRSPIESLSGIEKVAQLEDLSLILCGEVIDISHAARLKKLHTLHLEGSSRMTNLSVARDFSALKTLWLKAREIESCKFIPEMKSIEFASINALILDNDLSHFLKSKTLGEVWFSPRKRSYVPHLSPDDINEKLTARRTEQARTR